MAVQIPDPGTGNGQTGDNEYVFRKKVKDNFSDQTNAASRLVGEAPKNLMEVGAFGLGAGLVTMSSVEPKATGFYYLAGATKTYGGGNFVLDVNYAGATTKGFRISNSSYTNNFYLHGSAGASTSELRQGAKIWHSENATRDSNGFLKASSPIIQVFADKVELNGEAVDQDVSYKKNGIGDYTITTQSGLSTDGWYIELPKDMNGNPKVAVTLQETNGVISLKSYKRIFSMETFTFEPDLNEPLDIPDGRWIDLRLNEIPVEPSEPESEV